VIHLSIATCYPVRNILAPDRLFNQPVGGRKDLQRGRQTAASWGSGIGLDWADGRNERC
jgi:hypothetical protein